MIRTTRHEVTEIDADEYNVLSEINAKCYNIGSLTDTLRNPPYNLNAMNENTNSICADIEYVIGRLGKLKLMQEKVNKENARLYPEKN